MSRAAFLDRDGVINRKPAGSGYVTRWEDMDLLPGAAKAISLLNRIGFRVIVVTNQRCVAKGLLTASQLEAMHSRMCHELAALGARIDGVYYCPHEKNPPCSCRKPRPGMLLAAAREHRIDLKSSWMIGDSDEDVEAGRKVGCKTARILGTHPGVNGKADVVALSLLEAIEQVLRYERMAADQQAMDTASLLGPTREQWTG
jgi:D-glycero-D-manno-heptose 1,7-bisphosphate phosphatase